MADTTKVSGARPLPLPMKKTQKYYSFRENLWNHTYFTCAKVAKFYHLPTVKYYQTHPTEEQIRDMQENERLERKDQFTQAARLMDSGRLQRRKLERAIVLATQLQSRSKQLLSSLSQPASIRDSADASAVSVKAFRPAPTAQIQKNGWKDIDFLPVQQIRKFLPRKELELDDRKHYTGATADLLARRSQYQLQLLADADSKRQARDSARAELAKRHQASENLERRSGVLKYRSDPLVSTVTSLNSAKPFALGKSLTMSVRSEVLSQARALYQPKDPLLYSEFRGLIQAENRNAVKRLKAALSRSASLSQLSMTSLSLVKASPRLGD